MTEDTQMLQGMATTNGSSSVRAYLSASFGFIELNRLPSRKFSIAALSLIPGTLRDVNPTNDPCLSHVRSVLQGAELSQRSTGVTCVEARLTGSSTSIVSYYCL